MQPITCQATPAFISWLSAARGSLAVTTYQAGKLVLIGAHANTLEVVMREFDKPLGLDFRDDQLVLACHHSATVFANAPLLAPEYWVDQPGRYDRDLTCFCGGKGYPTTGTWSAIITEYAK